MTAPTVVRENGDGALHRARGSFSGTYTAESDVYNSGGVQLDGSGNIVITLGFEPTYFEILNLTDVFKQEWYKGFPATVTYDTPADGNVAGVSGTSIVVAAADTGTAPVTAKGAFTVTVDASDGAMTDNDNVFWRAEG